MIDKHLFVLATSLFWAFVFVLLYLDRFCGPTGACHREIWQLGRGGTVSGRVFCWQGCGDYIIEAKV